METVEELKEHIKELEKVIEDKDFEIDGLEKENDRPDDKIGELSNCEPLTVEGFSSEEIEREFKKIYDISTSMTDEMKFDLIMKNYHKVSLEDFEQFFKSKGLEIV